MKIVLMIDGLDVRIILKYSFKTLLLNYPRVILHDFNFIYTPYIWEMFLTGRRRNFFLLEFRRILFNIIKTFDKILLSENAIYKNYPALAHSGG